MPGIVGLVTKMPRSWAEPQLRRMVETLRHESTYTCGTWIDEQLGVYVGWVARNGSFAEQMPVQNEKGDVALVFAGEEFPDPGMKRQLKEKGHDVKEGGPSYLVHVYEADAHFPANLNGRFHGLLADRARGIAMLFNDRYGMQRIYYHSSKEAFYFSAEAKAILKELPELRTLDVRGLGEFVSCGCVLENRTLFKGIDVLPPASAWLFRSGALELKSSYFRPEEWENQPLLDPETYYQELRAVFSRNLPRYFNGSERVGLSLTGGLDTRMIVAWQKSPNGSVPCYSFGGMFRDCQDVVVARRVAKVWGQSHEVIPVGKDFLSRFPRYAERTVYLTDGCVEPTHSPDLYVNELAAQIAPVRMTGNYGGEVLRRVRAFKPVEPPAGLFRSEFLTHIDAAKKTYARLLRAHPLSFAVFRQAPWHHYGLLALEQTQVALRSPFLDNDLVQTVYRAPGSAVTSNAVSLRLIGDGNASLRKIRTDIGQAGSDHQLSAKIVRKALEFTFKAEYAYDYGMPQAVARVDHILSSLHLERLFLGRHKFYHFRLWYRDFLAQYVRDILLDSRTLSRPYLERKALEAMVEGHLNGGRNCTQGIHKMLTLELVHRLFLDP